MNKNNVFILIFLFYCVSIFSQVITINNATSEAIVQKSTANVPSIQTGEPFNYSIDFQNLDQTRTLTITDVLPAGLCYSASDIIADNSFLDFSGNVIPNPNGITGLIDTSALPNVTFNIPNNAKRGSFTITVRFCAGTTPNGFTVTNNICATYGTGTNSDENFCSTTGLTSTASAINPWGNITKEPLFPAILGSDSNYYIPTINGVSNYKIRVEKDAQYASSTFGMLNLQNVTISEMFLPCASVSLISGPGTLNTTTNEIILNNDLNSNVANEIVEFIVSVDYSGCTLTNGQTITNTVNLNGTPVGENPQTNIATDTADIIATDNLPGSSSGGVFSKTVDIINPVPGCLGVYSLSLYNDDNRPISLIELTDQLPNNILPKSINISGLINSASPTKTFDLSINNSAPTVISLLTSHSSIPSNWSGSVGNSVSLISHQNTFLYPGDVINVSIYFEIDNSVSVGTTINNCANYKGSIIDAVNNINLSFNEDNCASFTVESPVVKLCATKEVRKANTNNAFASDVTNIIPTDELEFKICIQNNGSLDFNGELVDVLDAKYEFISIVSSNLPSGTTFNQSGQTLTWSNINLQNLCANFFSINNCLNHANQSFCVVVKVKVKAFTPAGNIDNNAVLSDNNSNSFTTEFAKVNVIESSVLSFKKEISKDLISFTQSLTFNTICDDVVYYKITVTNLGNKDVSQYQIIDELPAINDVYFPSSLSRNSSFSYTNVIDNSSPDFTVSYLNTTPSSVNTPSNFDCTTVSTGNTTSSATTQSILYESTSSLLIGDSSEIIIESILPNSTSLINGDKAVNSAYLINCDPSNNIIIPSNMVELIIESPPSCSNLNLYPYSSAVPGLFPLTVAQELSVDWLLTKDKEYGDFDNDGDIDILYAKVDTNNNIYLYVLINNAGAGNIPTYSTPGVNLSFLGVSGVEYSFRFVDWDQDGWNDIIVHGPNGGTYLYINNQSGGINAGLMMLNGGFDYPSIPFGSPHFIEVGDLNNDGFPDLLISHQRNNVTNSWFGTVYFENNQTNTYPYFDLVSPQIFTNGVIENPFILDNNGSVQIPEIYDADCDGDNDIFISDPLFNSPSTSGARVNFHENNGGVTNNSLPNINTVGIPNQFGFLDDNISNSNLANDFIVTRIVDYFDNGCPIAIAFNPRNSNTSNPEFYYYLQEDCVCSDFHLLSLFDAEVKDSKLVLFPNPSSTTISISGDHFVELNFEIFDLLGRKISKGKYSSGETLDISNYKKGVYLIKLYQGSNSKTIKFIKQ